MRTILSADISKLEWDLLYFQEKVLLLIMNKFFPHILSIEVMKEEKI